MSLQEEQINGTREDLESAIQNLERSDKFQRALIEKLKESVRGMEESWIQPERNKPR